MSLTLYHSGHYFFVKSENFVDRGTRYLIIERYKSSIYEVQNDELFNEASKISEGSIFGIVGIMNILG